MFRSCASVFRFLSDVAGLLVLITLAPSVQAEVPAFVTWSARLTDGTGWGETTTVDLTVRLFSCGCAVDADCASPCPQDGDVPFWTTTHLNIPISDGYFSVKLGRCDEVGVCTDDPGAWTFPQDLPPQVWVEIIADGSLLQPRQPLGSVPYAVAAAQARFSTSNGVPVGMIGTFKAACPAGWDRVEELDGFSIRGGESYGVGKTNDTGTGATVSKKTGPGSNDGSYDDADLNGIWYTCYGSMVWAVPTDSVARCKDHDHTLASTAVNVSVTPKHYTVVLCEFKGCFGGAGGDATNCE
jgi:hypothetical protein